MPERGFRLERDSMGELRVPADALWGAQTQRALLNFDIAGRPMSPPFITALAAIKRAAARANGELGLLDAAMAAAIESAARQVAEGQHHAAFPVDVWQTGSGTSTNMNANEVIAHLAGHALGREVHPNDHVNLCQSSNDVIPSTIHVAAACLIQRELLPAAARLIEAIAEREAAFGETVKTGRTHLMDAMPLTLAQELSGWRTQIEHARDRICAVEPRLLQLALGGTAVGTGINAHPEFGVRACAALAADTRIAFRPADNAFEAIATQDTAVELSGQLKVLAVGLIKIANDLRWMNSGPLAGLGEIRLPALQPGSSIMPGKVNPVIPEAVAMAATQVIGHDAAITIAGQSGNFQLNVMLPLIASNLLDSLQWLARAMRALADRAIAGFVVDDVALGDALARNPVLVTALNPAIGYEASAAIAKRALAEGRPIAEVAAEQTDLGADEIAARLDPLDLTRGGFHGGGTGG